MHPPGPDTPAANQLPSPEPAKVPPISAYWPDLPQRIGPPADYYSWEPDRRSVPVRRETPLIDLEEPPGPAPLPTPRRHRRVLVLAVVIGLLAGGGMAALVATRWPADDPAPAAATRAPAAPVPPAPIPSAPAEPATAVTPAGQIQQATFVVVSDAADVNLRTAVLSGDLYRISSPAGSSVRPSVTIKDGTIRLTLVDTGRRGPSAVDIVLAAGVRWALRVDGNLAAGELDLRDGRVTQVRLAGDAADLRLVMPEPDGAVPVRVTGGINRLRVSVPGRTPMRIRTRGGAGEVILDGKTVRGVARNTAFQTEGWRAGRAGVEVDATAGLGALRAERRTR